MSDALTDPDAATGPWQNATITHIVDETSTTKSFGLALDRPAPHLAGQHFIIRLTADDGYSAARSYSVASAPGDPSNIELTIERLDDGEVSTFMHDGVEVGDEIEVRGPIGGWFIWKGQTPALLIGGGSGVVPLMAMLRLARATGRSDLLSLVASARTPGDLYYPDELPGPETTVIYTRETPPSWPRPAGRLAADDLAAHVRPDITAFICGSSGFADSATGLLTDLGLPADHIRVERFGPTS